MATDVSALISSVTQWMHPGLPYREPDDVEGSQGQAGLTMLLAGDVDGAKAALGPLGFTVTSGVDAVCGRRYALAVSEMTAPPVVGERVWGLYLVDLSGSATICFAAPHAVYDEQTEQIAVDLWRRVPGSVLAMTTLYRVLNDPVRDYARAANNLFHRFLIDTIGGQARLPQVQIHGFGDRAPDATGRRHEQVVVSTGPGRKPLALGQQIASGLARDGFSVSRNWVPADRADSSLVAETSNVQGKAAHEKGYPWLHIEIATMLRATGGAPTLIARQRRQKLTAALGSAICPADLETSAMRVVSPGGRPVLPMPGNLRPDRKPTWSDAVPAPRWPGDGAVILYDAQGGHAKTAIPRKTGPFTEVGTLQTDWPTTYTVLMPYELDGEPGAGGVLCYDPLACTFTLRTNDAAIVTVVTRDASARRSWTHLVPLRLTGGEHGLLCYEPVEGRAQAYRFSATTGLSEVGAEITDVPPLCSAVVSGSFGGPKADDVLFYQPVTEDGTGRGTFYSHDGAGSLTPMGEPHLGWRTTWTAVVPWRLDAHPARTALLLYEAAAGRARFCVPQGANPMRAEGLEIMALPTTWRTLTAGTFDDGSHLQLLCHEF